MVKEKNIGYTQTPNIRYDKWAKQMKSAAEIKCVDIIIRETFGWHRDETEGLTIDYIMKETGLSKPSVVKGLDLAMKHGIAERLRRRVGKRGHTFAYRLIMRPEFRLIEPAPDAAKQIGLPFDILAIKPSDGVKKVNSVPKPTKLKVLTPSMVDGVQKVNSVEVSPIIDLKKAEKDGEIKRTHTRQEISTGQEPTVSRPAASPRVGHIPLSKFDKKIIQRYAWAEHEFTNLVNAYLMDNHFDSAGLSVVKGTGRPVRRGIENPGGWATAAHRSGEFDDDIQKWIDDPEMFDFYRWKKYGT